MLLEVSMYIWSKERPQILIAWGTYTKEYEMWSHNNIYNALISIEKTLFCQTCNGSQTCNGRTSEDTLGYYYWSVLELFFKVHFVL